MILSSRKTISGVPGRSDRSTSNRIPMLVSALRTDHSKLLPPERPVGLDFIWTLDNALQEVGHYFF